MRLLSLGFDSLLYFNMLCLVQSVSKAKAACCWGAVWLRGVAGAARAPGAAQPAGAPQHALPQRRVCHGRTGGVRQAAGAGARAAGVGGGAISAHWPTRTFLHLTHVTHTVFIAFHTKSQFALKQARLSFATSRSRVDRVATKLKSGSPHPAPCTLCPEC